MLLVLALAVCPGRALAASDVPIPGMDELTEALPEEAAPILSGVSPEKLPQESVWRTLLRTAWEKVRSSAADICRTGGIRLCVCVRVSLTDTLDLGSRAPPYITFAAVAVIGTATISDLRSYLSLGTETLQTLSDYSHVLLPVLSSAAAASGAAGSAAAKYAATAVCMDVLLSVARSVLVPCVCGYAALSVADAAVGNEILKTAKKIMKSVCTALLSAVCVAFTAWLSLTGVVTGTADALAALPYLSIVRPRGTFYLFPGVEKTGMDDRAFCDFLLEKAHILASPGSLFGRAGKNHIRLACTVSDEKIKEAMRRFEALGKYFEK